MPFQKNISMYIAHSNELQEFISGINVSDCEKNAL